MKNVLSIIMILILSMFLAGCDKDIEFVSATAPKADAGKDINITEDETTEIVGKATVGSGEIVGYAWKEGSVLRSVLKKFDYGPSKVGKHTLTFTVYDSNDKNDSDEMIVTVKEVIEVNASK